MPSLQLHQLRVAAVAKLICNNFKKPLNERDVVLACLFHDMGNIVKFDLMVFPELVKPEGVEYWEAVKVEFRKKYGNDQHEVSEKIAREIGLSERVIDCIGAVAFSKAEQILAAGTWEQKICEYADSRVSPNGVDSLESRLREARKRYLVRNADNPIATTPQDRFEVVLEAEREIERQIFANATITPESVTETAAAPVIKELWEYPIA